MIEIPVEATPSQQLLVTLDGQNCVIALYQRGNRLFMDVNADGVDVCKGAVCLPTVGQPQLASEFNGAFYFADYQSKPNQQEAPQWRGLGTRYRLIYLTGDEVASLTDEKWADALAEVAHG